MTKKLSELFNLPAEELGTDANDAVLDRLAEQQQALQDADTVIDKIDAALPLVTNLEADDNELDELANMAKEKFTELMDLGFNVEPRYSSEILQTASTLLGHAISARTAKIDKKLKMIQLQLNKAKLDQATEKADTTAAPVDGQGIILDRNELLKAIIKKNSN